MARQGAAPASAARPLQHPLLVAPGAAAQPIKVGGRIGQGRPAALRWAGLTSTAAPPPQLGSRLEGAAAQAGASGFLATLGGRAAHLQQLGCAASASSAAPALVQGRRRQRLVWAASVPGPEAAEAAAESEAGAGESDVEERRAARIAAAAAAAAAAAEAAGVDSPRSRPRRLRQGRLSADREQELARVVATGGRGAEGAAAELAAANVALVHHLARRFDGRGLSREDVVGEGLGGLRRAALRYRPGTEARFATFAIPVIWQAMQKAVHGQARSVRLPAHHHTDMRRVRAATEELAAEVGRAPKLEAVAARCGLSIEYTAHLVKQMKQGEGRARLPPLASPSRQGAPAEPLGPEDESDDAAEAEEVQAHKAAVRREVEAMLARLAKENEKLARVVRLRHRLGEDGAGEEGGTTRLRPFKEVGQTLECTGAHASALYKQALRKMESMSRRAVGQPAHQPGTRQNAQQQLEAASRDGRLAAAVARLSEERQLLLALRCGWLQAPRLQSQGRPPFRVLGNLWGRSACWASSNCSAAAKDLRQILLPFAEDGFKPLHALESEHLQPHFPPQLLQRWEQLAWQLHGKHEQAAPAKPAQDADSDPAQPAPPVASADQSMLSTARSAAQASAPAASSAAAADAASAATGSSAVDCARWPAQAGDRASSVVPFRRRRRAGSPRVQRQAEPEIVYSPELYALMAQISEQQPQHALAGRR